MLEPRLLVVLNHKKAANLEAAEAETTVKAAATFQRMTMKKEKKRQRQRSLVSLVDAAAFPNSCWQPSELKSVAASKA